MKDYFGRIEEYLCAELGVDELTERQYQLIFDTCGEYLGLGYSVEGAAEELFDRVQELAF